MINYLRSSLLLIFLSFVFFACNDSPTQVGSDLIPEEDKISFQQFDSYTNNVNQSSNFYQEKLELGIADKLILGKTDFSQSSILLRFNPALVDSMNTKFKNGQLYVSKSWITMKSSYSLGSNTDPYDFTIHQIRKNWGLLYFNVDSLNTLQTDAEDMVVSGSKVVTDSSLTCEIKNNVVTEWLKRNNDSTTIPANYGFLMKPTSFTKRMMGFNAVDQTSSYNSILLNVELSQGNTPVDTLELIPYMDNYSVELVGNFPINTKNIILQAGYAIRGQVFFNISSLPKNIILNRATLELTLNNDLTRDGSPSSDTLYTRILADSTTRKLSADSSYSAYIVKKENIYTGDISWMVQKWINGSVNQGLILELADETYSTARIVFYGSKESNPSLRPRLKLIYSLK